MNREYQHKFQPICERILKSRTVEDVDSLYQMVKESEGFYLQNVQQFLLFPLITRIGEHSSGPNRDDKVKLIETLRLILEKTEIRQVNALKTILIVVSNEVYDFQKAQLVPDVSEELVIAVLHCISVANRQSSSDSVEQFFNPDNGSQISQILYIILLLLDKYEYREVKLQALNTLQTLLHVDNGSDLSDIVLRSQISGIVFFALPMLWGSLSKLILNDPKIGKKVMERALFTLGRVVGLIMEDDKEDDKQEKSVNIQDFKALIVSTNAPPADPSAILNQKEKKRTLEWLQAAGKKLREPFKNLISVTGHESPAIRKELGICCEYWIRNCRKSLHDNMDTFAEILLVLSEDDDPGNRGYFEGVLRSLKEQENEDLSTVNRSLIQRHLLRISRIIQRRSVKEQLTALTLLKAQLKSLSDEDLLLLLSNTKNLDVFAMNLLMFVEFNYDNPELLKDEHAVRDFVDPLSQSSIKPWEEYKYFDAKSKSRIPELLFEILSSVITKGPTIIRILIDYLTDLLRDKPMNCAEILMILQLIVSSSCRGNNSELMESLMEELLDDRLWNLTYQIIVNDKRGVQGRSREHLKVSEHTDGLYESSLVIKYVDLRDQSEDDGLEEYLVSPQEAKTNVLVTCLLLETIPSFANQMGPEKFQRHLFKILFRILSCAGNSNYCIHSAGQFCLKELTRIYEYKGVRQLIMANSDYVMFFINQSLRDPHKSKYALDVISVILDFCSGDVLGYVELIVNRLLDECSKYHRMGNLASYLKIFGLFLKYLGSSFEGGEESEKESSVEEIMDSWLSILNQRPEEDFDVETESVDNKEEPDQTEEEPPGKKPIPKDVEIAQKILRVALKHVSSKNQSEVLAAMETLTWGIAILKHHNQDDELLPIVHLIWVPLSQRFTVETTNPVILRNSFKMLTILANAAKDFIHRRTVDEVIPALNRILRSCWTTISRGEKGHEGDGERFSQNFKLVQEILENYHILVIRLNIQQKPLDDILSSVALFLQKRLKPPQTLCKAATESFEALKSFDGGAVFQKVQQILE